MMPDHSIAAQRWSTPLGNYQHIGHRRVATQGEGWWHPNDDEPFAYLEFNADHVEYLAPPPALHVPSPQAQHR